MTTAFSLGTNLPLMVPPAPLPPPLPPLAPPGLAPPDPAELPPIPTAPPLSVVRPPLPVVVPALPAVWPPLLVVCPPVPPVWPPLLVVCPPLPVLCPPLPVVCPPVPPVCPPPPMVCPPPPVVCPPDPPEPPPELLSLAGCAFNPQAAPRMAANDSPTTPTWVHRLLRSCREPFLHIISSLQLRSSQGQNLPPRWGVPGAWIAHITIAQSIIRRGLPPRPMKPSKVAAAKGIALGHFRPA